jgi:indole-3-glycerol phosphate synthase
VLTDKKFFQGGFENLKAIRDAGVQCPLLCKEFIVDAYQILKARASGADAILLIAAVLPNADLEYFTKAASKLGMTCLIEVHSEAELKRVLKVGDIDKHILGINNRNLETFEVGCRNRLLHFVDRACMAQPCMCLPLHALAKRYHVLMLVSAAYCARHVSRLH